MTQRFEVNPGGRIAGTIRVPGDKSISHRALMFGALAEGETRISGFLPGEDCLATLAAVRELGVGVERPTATDVVVHGSGYHALKAPARPLDMGNSGTAMRLFAGLLAAQPFDSVLIGDESLSRRPMERVAGPLRQMGAQVATTNGCPPVRITGGARLVGIDYRLPVASAQVKSAVLLAGLQASGETTVHEPAPSRDHTERMLQAFGVPLRTAPGAVTIAGGARLKAARVDVPGDLSSAAFPILAACVAGAGDLTLENVGLNPTRTGILEILRLMGADLLITPEASRGGEPAGTIRVRATRLRGVAIPPALVPLAIDEFPMLFVAAALADGVTTISGAEELRHKESDRISAMAAGLRALGVSVEERPDGAVIRGGTLRGGTVDSKGDHRVAMSFAVGAVAAAGPIEILDVENVATSFPGFVPLMQGIGLGVTAGG
ncbi:MAG: 3-phosphoshikimate 1-carboxyvinyltransferase [Chromatiales bacterium]|nr:3-phosphoshikimate 1-carboxyvinyltransferase [Chromatiales bacterium]